MKAVFYVGEKKLKKNKQQVMVTFDNYINDYSANAPSPSVRRLTTAIVLHGGMRPSSDILTCDHCHG